MAFGELFAVTGVMIDVEHRTHDLDDVRPLVGRAEIEATAREWFDQTPTFDYEIVDLLADATRAVKLWRYAVPIDTERREFEGMTWLACSNGEILEARVYFDSYRLVDVQRRRPRR